MHFIILIRLGCSKINKRPSWIVLRRSKVPAEVIHKLFEGKHENKCYLKVSMINSSPSLSSASSLCSVYSCLHLVLWPEIWPERQDRPLSEKIIVKCSLIWHVYPSVCPFVRLAVIVVDVNSFKIYAGQTYKNVGDFVLEVHMGCGSYKWQKKHLIGGI